MLLLALQNCSIDIIYTTTSIYIVKHNKMLKKK